VSRHVEPPPWIEPAKQSPEQKKASTEALEPLLELMKAEGYVSLAINLVKGKWHVRFREARNRPRKDAR
jgi:hypothetical protein